MDGNDNPEQSGNGIHFIQHLRNRCRSRLVLDFLKHYRYRLGTAFVTVDGDDSSQQPTDCDHHSVQSDYSVGNAYESAYGFQRDLHGYHWGSHALNAVDGLGHSEFAIQRHDDAVESDHCFSHADQRHQRQ